MRNFYKSNDETNALTEEDLMVAVQTSSDALNYIDNPSEELINLAISRYGTRALHFVPKGYKISEEQRYRALKVSAIIDTTTRYEEYPLNKVLFDDDDIIYILERNSGVLQYIENPTHEMYMAAMKYDVRVYEVIPKHRRTVEMCMYAVSNFGQLLKYTDDPTYEMCLAAVKNMGSSVAYVPEQHRTEEICWEALKTDPRSLRFIPNPTKNMILYALSIDGHILIEVDKPTKEMILTAILSKKLQSSAQGFIQGGIYE